MGIAQRLTLAGWIGRNRDRRAMSRPRERAGRNGVLGTCTHPPVGRHVDRSSQARRPADEPGLLASRHARGGPLRRGGRATLPPQPPSTVERFELTGYAAPGRAGRLRASSSHLEMPGPRRGHGVPRGPALAEPPPPPTPAVRGPDLQARPRGQESQRPSPAVVASDEPGRHRDRGRRTSLHPGVERAGVDRAGASRLTSLSHRRR